MISIILSPFMGLIVDKLGKNVTFVFISLLVTIASHMMLAFTFINPYISMVSIVFVRKLNNFLEFSALKIVLSRT